MNPEERQQIEKVATRIETVTRRRTARVVAAVIGAALLFMFLQTVLILLAAGATSKHQRELADRIDRNLAFTVCILAVHPDRRDDDDILRCYKYADSLYPELTPPLPTPELTPTTTTT